jgi:hypothetical protein
LDFGGDGRRVGDTVVVASDAGVDTSATGRVIGAGGATDSKIIVCGVGRTGEPAGDEKISGVPARYPKPEVPLASPVAARAFKFTLSSSAQPIQCPSDFPPAS